MSATPSAADLTMAVLIASFLMSASKRGSIEANPMRDGYERLSRGTRRDQIWSAQEIEILRTQARPDMRDAALMALWTMQRQGDLLTMTPMAYSQSTGTLRIKQQKTGAFVMIKPAEEILPIITRAIGQQRVLTNSYGDNWTSSGFKSSWRKEMIRLGIKGRTFHDLRGTAITWAYYNLPGSHDDKIQTIAAISGHGIGDADAIIRKSYMASAEVNSAIGRGGR
ncbi:MAG: hypothetical protein U5K75_10665 [Ahrensia sp.]|nr:hypothetical protein [Ahrensia sp.]